MCLCVACTHGLTESGAYSIGVRGDGNRVSLAAGDGVDGNSVWLPYTVFIESPQGIGEAVFAWWGNESPHHLSFVLALQGLEDFRLTWADTTVVVSVNSTNLGVMQSVVTHRRDERSLTADSPFWMAAQLPGVEQPHFRMRAPQAFVDDAPRIWSVAWIDFYR
jgi:hypothetical protein